MPVPPLNEDSTLPTAHLPGQYSNHHPTDLSAEAAHALEVIEGDARGKTGFRRFNAGTVVLFVMELGVSMSIAQEHGPVLGATTAVLLMVGTGVWMVLGSGGKTPMPVHVKVTRGLQPVNDGHGIHIQHGPTFYLNHHGELELASQYRGCEYELIDKHQRVKRKGIVPRDGSLKIDLG